MELGSNNQHDLIAINDYNLGEEGDDNDGDNDDNDDDRESYIGH